MVHDYHRCLSIVLDPMVNFIKDCLYIKVRREETIKILQIHIEWSIRGVDNKAVDMLCAGSMNEDKT